MQKAMFCNVKDLISYFNMPVLHGRRLFAILERAAKRTFLKYHIDI